MPAGAGRGCTGFASAAGDRRRRADASRVADKGTGVAGLPAWTAAGAWHHDAAQPVRGDQRALLPCRRNRRCRTAGPAHHVFAADRACRSLPRPWHGAHHDRDHSTRTSLCGLSPLDRTGQYGVVGHDSGPGVSGPSVGSASPQRRLVSTVARCARWAKLSARQLAGRVRVGDCGRRSESARALAGGQPSLPRGRDGGAALASALVPKAHRLSPVSHLQLVEEVA